MASNEQLTWTEARVPSKNGIDAFNAVLPKIKSEIVKSRLHWNKHEPRMWRRAADLTDDQLVAFTIEDDLVEITTAATSYGTIILGKIRIPAINDAEGEGFVHVRIHDPPNRGTGDVLFHSIFTDEVREAPEDTPIDYRAIQTKDKPLKFFNE